MPYTKDIIIAAASAVIGGIVTLCIEKIKEQRIIKKEKSQKYEEVYNNRPEFHIEEMKDRFSRPGTGIKSDKCDLELYIPKIKSCCVENTSVELNYGEYNKNINEWVCRKFFLKNIGKTAVYSLTVAMNFKRSACLFSYNEILFELLDQGSVNYSHMYDRRIGPGEIITIKLCFHKDHIIGGLLSALLDIYSCDDHNRYWAQPFFAPDDKLYESRLVSYNEYRDRSHADIAIECFKKPYLW